MNPKSTAGSLNLPDGSRVESSTSSTSFEGWRRVVAWHPLRAGLYCAAALPLLHGTPCRVSAVPVTIPDAAGFQPEQDALSRGILAWRGPRALPFSSPKGAFAHLPHSASLRLCRRFPAKPLFPFQPTARAAPGSRRGLLRRPIGRERARLVRVEMIHWIIF